MKLCTIAAIKGMTMDQFREDICDRCGNEAQCEDCAMNAIEQFGEMARDMVKEEQDED